MVKKFSIWFIALQVTAGLLPATAQDKAQNADAGANEKKITRYGFTMDQDMFAELAGLQNQDRNYTMGMGLFLSNNKWAGRKLFYPLKKLDEIIARNRTGEQLVYNATICFGVTAFTPEYLGNNQADSLYYMVMDRPFSSLTFLSFKYQSASLYRSETNQFVIGVMGLDIARSVQTHIHEHHWFGSTRPIPYGWKNQISEGGEPTFLLSNKVDRLLSKRSLDHENSNCIITQFIFSREYRVGYYTGANAAIAMRLGILDPKNWTSYDVYQLQYANNIFKTTPRLKSELYFQASIRPQFILYNALLNGQFKENFHTLSFSETGHIVVEGFAGIGTTITNCQKNFSIGLLAYVSGRSPEFKTRLTHRSHTWGGLQLVFTRIKP